MKCGCMDTAKCQSVLPTWASSTTTWRTRSYGHLRVVFTCTSDKSRLCGPCAMDLAYKEGASTALHKLDTLPSVPNIWNRKRRSGLLHRRTMLIHNEHLSATKPKMIQQKIHIERTHGTHNQEMSTSENHPHYDDPPL